MTLRHLPHDELDRHHRQGRQAMLRSLAEGNTQAYRAAEQLETKARREKIRRARHRGP